MADNVRTIIVSWSEYECNVEAGSGGCHIVVCYCHGSRPQATHKLQAGPCWNQDYIPTFADAADWHMVTGCQESSCKFPISYQWSRRSITEYRYEAVPLIRLSGESAGARGASRGRRQWRLSLSIHPLVARQEHYWRRGQRRHWAEDRLLMQLQGHGHPVTTN